MPRTTEHFSKSVEVLIVGLARTGDRDAFAELVRRRQSWIRNLMRRCCGDVTLADDLSQQVFLQAWRQIHKLHHADRFGAWLKRLAINVWLQHLRTNDALRDAEAYDEALQTQPERSGITIDLDRALATLPVPVRLCLVLSYYEGMTHDEISELTKYPLGTVKSHIQRGKQRLKKILSAYGQISNSEVAP